MQSRLQEMVARSISWIKEMARFWQFSADRFQKSLSPNQILHTAWEDEIHYLRWFLRIDLSPGRRPSFLVQNPMYWMLWETFSIYFFWFPPFPTIHSHTHLVQARQCTSAPTTEHFEEPDVCVFRLSREWSHPRLPIRFLMELNSA